MIPKDKIFNLIAIYLYVCDLYDNELKYFCQRFTNNDHPAFTDQEVITIYLYAMHVEQKLKIKQIHNFANGYLLSWFPKLPGYVAFTLRINRLSEVFKHIAGTLLSSNCPDECDLQPRVPPDSPLCRHRKCDPGSFSNQTSSLVGRCILFPCSNWLCHHPMHDYSDSAT